MSSHNMLKQNYPTVQGCRFWHATLKIALHHMSTSSSTDGGSEQNLLLRGV